MPHLSETRESQGSKTVQCLEVRRGSTGDIQRYAQSLRFTATRTCASPAVQQIYEGYSSKLADEATSLSPTSMHRSDHPRHMSYSQIVSPSLFQSIIPSLIALAEMRDKLKGQDLSFTEIAKIVGESWQVLSVQEKEPCERQAQALKEKYYTNLTEYKKTPQYALYQEYLADFKAKHSNQQGQNDTFTCPFNPDQL